MDFTLLLPLIELAANTTLTVLSAQGITPANTGTLASALETSINPLISAIGKKSATTTDVMAGYGAMIGVLNALKQNTALEPAVLAKVTEYLAAAQDGTSAFLLASKGLDLSKLTPVEPIA